MDTPNIFNFHHSASHGSMRLKYRDIYFNYHTSECTTSLLFKCVREIFFLSINLLLNSPIPIFFTNSPKRFSLFSLSIASTHTSRALSTSDSSANWMRSSANLGCLPSFPPIMTRKHFFSVFIVPVGQTS